LEQNQSSKEILDKKPKAIEAPKPEATDAQSALAHAAAETDDSIKQAEEDIRKDQ
jgi:hypothetical protein